jgi:hypothetical protein
LATLKQSRKLGKVITGTCLVEGIEVTDSQQAA